MLITTTRTDERWRRPLGAELAGPIRARRAALIRAGSGSSRAASVWPPQRRGSGVQEMPMTTTDPTATRPTTTTFAAAVRALSELGPITVGQPKKKKKTDKPAELTKQASERASVKEAWAWGNLADWPRNPPLESLFLLKDAPSGFGDDEDNPASGKAFVSGSNFGNAIGTWNARDEEGRWACEPGEWILALADLARGGDEDGEDGEGVGVAFACWKVAEGYAVAITRYGAASKRLPAILGMAWPGGDAWKTASLWYGE